MVKRFKKFKIRKDGKTKIRTMRKPPNFWKKAFRLNLIRENMKRLRKKQIRLSSEILGIDYNSKTFRNAKMRELNLINKELKAQVELQVELKESVQDIREAKTKDEAALIANQVISKILKNPKYNTKAIEKLLDSLGDRDLIFRLLFNNGKYHFVNIANKSTQFLLELLIQKKIQTENDSFGSEALDSYDIKDIVEIKVIRLNPKREIKNRAGGFFPLINVFDDRLSRYQIYTQEQANDNKRRKEVCLIHSLKQQGISKAICNSIKLKYVVEGKVKKIGKNQLKDISEMINRDIILYQIFQSNDRIKKTKHKTPNQETKGKDIHIAIFLDHYFTYETSIYKEYGALNYEQIRHEPNWETITGYDEKKNKYIRRKTTKKINSLKLVNILYKNGLFVQGDMKNFHKTESNILTKNQIFLDVLRNEQMGDPREVNYILDQQEGKEPESESEEEQAEEKKEDEQAEEKKEKKPKTIYIDSYFYADIESFTNINEKRITNEDQKAIVEKSEMENGAHHLAMLGVIGEDCKKVKTFLRRENEPIENLIKHWQNYMSKISKDKTKKEANKPEYKELIKAGKIVLKPQISCYFHNLKYDLAIFEEFVNVKEKLKKEGTIYQMKAKHYGIDIIYKDSFKLIPLGLNKFKKTFDLKIGKKDAIAYEYYNPSNINKRIKLSEYIKYLPLDEHKIFYEEVIKCDSYRRDETFNPYTYYIEYLKLDCLTLRAGIRKFNKILLNISNGELSVYDKLTISSLAHKHTSKNGAYTGIYKMTGNLRKFVSKALTGGRVYTNPEYLRKLIIKAMIALDACSLYPSACERLCREYGLPMGPAQRLTDFKNWNNYNYAVLKIKILKVNKKLNIPLITTKDEKGTLQYVNEVPKEDIYLDSITLKEYIKYHDIEYEILDGVFWDSGYNKALGDIVSHLYDARLKAKAKGKYTHDEKGKEREPNTPLSNTLKLILNSIYGKNIIKPSKYTTKIYNEVQWKKDEKGQFISSIKPVDNYIASNLYKIEDYYEIRKGLFEIRELKPDKSYNQAHIGAFILSMSKVIMNEVFHICEQNNIDISYQDTDSIHIEARHLDLLDRKFKECYKRPLQGELMGQFNSDFSLKGHDKKYGLVVSEKSIVIAKKIYWDRLRGRNSEGEIIYADHIKLKGVTKEGIEEAVSRYGGKEIKENKPNGAENLFQALARGDEVEFILNPYDKLNNKQKVCFEYKNGKVYTRNKFIRTMKLEKLE